MSATLDSVQAEIAYRRQQVRRSAARTVRNQIKGRSRARAVRQRDGREGRTDRPRRS